MDQEQLNDFIQPLLNYFRIKGEVKMTFKDFEKLIRYYDFNIFAYFLSEEKEQLVKDYMMIEQTEDINIALEMLREEGEKLGGTWAQTSEGFTLGKAL
jgi:hypothetical protein